MLELMFLFDRGCGGQTLLILMLDSTPHNLSSGNAAIPMTGICD
jgi:hypothetical protein